MSEPVAIGHRAARSPSAVALRGDCQRFVETCGIRPGKKVVIYPEVLGNQESSQSKGLII
jgi:hypothetical protein